MKRYLYLLAFIAFVLQGTGSCCLAQVKELSHLPYTVEKGVENSYYKYTIGTGKMYFSKVSPKTYYDVYNTQSPYLNLPTNYQNAEEYLPLVTISEVCSYAIMDELKKYATSRDSSICLTISITKKGRIDDVSFLYSEEAFKDLPIQVLEQLEVYMKTHSRCSYKTNGVLKGANWFCRSLVINPSDPLETYTDYTF